MKDIEIQNLINNSKKLGVDWHGTADNGRFKFPLGTIVITGAPEDEREIIDNQAKELGLGEIYYNETEATDSKSVGEFKANKIKELGIDLYLDDDPSQIYWIKKFNPEANVLYINKKNYVIFTYSFDGLSYAIRLKEEGNSVILAVLSPEDIGESLDNPQKRIWEEKRWELGDGIIDKYPAKKVFNFLMNNEDIDDYFIDFDFNVGGKYAEKLEKKGYIGLFPREKHKEFETNRQLGQDFVRENYKDLVVPEEKEFKTTEEALKFINETQKFYVIKANEDNVQAQVPISDRFETYIKEVENFLKSNKKELEKDGFILQEKIFQPIEITPEALYIKGKPIYFMADIECKKLGAGETGSNTGCSMDLNFPIDAGSRLTKVALEPYFKTAKEEELNNFMDASMLIDTRMDKPYFGEYCPRRGYNSFLTELALLPSASLWFESVAKGENPFRDSKKFAASIRIFNLSRGRNGPAKDLLIQAEGKDVWLFDAKKKGEKLFTCGVDDNLGVVTGSGDTPEGAIKAVKHNLKSLIVKDMYYRTDIEDTENWYAPLYRYNYLKNNDWL